MSEIIKLLKNSYQYLIRIFKLSLQFKGKKKITRNKTNSNKTAIDIKQSQKYTIMQKVSYLSQGIIDLRDDIATSFYWRLREIQIISTSKNVNIFKVENKQNI